jgi:hypothetical protein
MSGKPEKPSCGLCRQSAFAPGWSRHTQHSLPPLSPGFRAFDPSFAIANKAPGHLNAYPVVNVGGIIGVKDILRDRIAHLVTFVVITSVVLAALFSKVPFSIDVGALERHAMLAAARTT